MTQTTTSNKQSPPSAGFLFMCVNKFDTVTALRYYLSHGAQHGAARIGDKKMGWIVTVERNDGFAKAEFQWDESFDSCIVKAHGFDDEEYEMLLENGAHEGANVEGYAVSIK